MSRQDERKKRQQSQNIILITFWSQFATYAFNIIFILFLTRPLIQSGLGYSQENAYIFMGLTNATGYLMPLLGGYMADQILGVRRAILLGSVLLCFAYFLVMLSGYTIAFWGDRFFLIAYALVPVSNSFLMGTASGMISHIYSNSAHASKQAMTWFYIAINVGALLATIIAPSALNSAYGPLSILTIVFLGKAIAATNFATHYKLYDDAIWGKDREKLTQKKIKQVVFYFLGLYAAVLFAYTHVYLANWLIAIACVGGIAWFLQETYILRGTVRDKQFLALILILEAVIFFVIYNQMASTLILFAKQNSDHAFFWFTVSPAQYQMLNPIIILAIGSFLPKLYKRLPQFTIPYQFAMGVILSGISLLVIVLACLQAQYGLVNGNYIALCYLLISIAELLVSAIGLSMIGLYCNPKTLAFAMGVWYLGASLSNTISGRLAAWVALPEGIIAPEVSLLYYQNYYLVLGLVTLGLGFLMYVFAYALHPYMKKRGVQIV